MLSNFKINLIGGFAFVVSIFSLLFKSEKLKRKTQELKMAKKVVEINRGVAKSLKNKALFREDDLTLRAIIKIIH